MYVTFPIVSCWIIQSLFSFISKLLCVLQNDCTNSSCHQLCMRFPFNPTLLWLLWCEHLTGVRNYLIVVLISFFPDDRWWTFYHVHIVLDMPILETVFFHLLSFFMVLSLLSLQSSLSFYRAGSSPIEAE